MCENLKPDRIRCEACRTINLAKHINQPKPDMQMYDKCFPAERLACPRVAELPLHPTCIKVCTKEEYNLKKSGKKVALPKIPYPHGKLMYAVKAGILVGAVYFTYTQGVWGDQQDVTECIRRWQEYIRSINTRRPPTFDQCGNVVVFLPGNGQQCYPTTIKLTNQKLWPPTRLPSVVTMAKHPITGEAYVQLVDCDRLISLL